MGATQHRNRARFQSQMRAWIRSRASHSRASHRRASHSRSAALALVISGSIFVSACSPGGAGDNTAAEEQAGGSDRPVVLTTFTVLADIAKNVAGDDLRVESLTKPGTEIHSYEPTPLAIAKASEADLILDNGLGLEAWFEKFVEQIDVPHVVVSDGIEPIPIAAASSDGSRAATNPHAWMSPIEAEVYVNNIVTAFSELDPQHAAEFESRGEAYVEQITNIREELQAALDEVPASQRALVTCEGAFSYLARDAGLEEQYIWPVNADTQATPQRLSRTIEYVEAHDVAAVFCESTVSDSAMQQVAQATGARFGGTLYVDSLSEPDGPVPSYLELLEHDAETIAAGLAGAQ